MISRDQKMVSKDFVLAKTFSTGIKFIFEYGIMGFVVLISVFPLVWVLMSSFKTNLEILDSAFSIPKTPSFIGYSIALETAAIPMRFLTSMLVASFTTAIAVIIYAMASYVLARSKFRMKNAIFALLISTLLIPTNAMIQPIYTIVRALGLYDTKGALILVYTAFAMPMCLFLLRSYFISIPTEIEESAYIEGASFFQTFWRIMLPLARPAVASAAVMTFISAWNELLYALLLISTDSNRTMPLTMKYFTSMFSFNYTPMFAALVLCIAPTVILYVLLQEQIMQSVIVGSVKG